MIIAVDGWPAAGKGTLSQALAKHFGYAFLDTGTLYRATALAVLRAGGRLEDAPTIVQAAQNLDYQTRPLPDGRWGYWLDGEEVTGALRSPEAGVGASLVAANLEARTALEGFQRDFAAQHAVPGVVLDGQDIGTYICPQAPVKFFLRGDIPTLARRRWHDFQARGDSITLAEVEAALRARITRDAERPNRPCVPAADAVIIDTTHLSAAAVLAQAVGVVDGQKG